MASISRDGNGTRRIQFVAPDGKRKAIRLGKISQRNAEAIKFRVEHLLAAQVTGNAVEADTARWVASLEPAMADKLARVGLIAAPEAADTLTLGAHLASYFAKRTDVKESTLTHWGHTGRCLLAYFGDDRPLASVTAGDAKDWEALAAHQRGPRGRLRWRNRRAVRQHGPQASRKRQTVLCRCCGPRANR